MSDDRRKQEGKAGRGSGGPLNAAADMLAAAWGTAVGIGCAVLGIRRSGRDRGSATGAGPLPDRPETSGAVQPQPGPGGRPPQKRVSPSEPEPSTKAAPAAKATGRRSTSERPSARRGARQASPAKTGTASKAAGMADKGAPQRPAAKRGGSGATSAGARGEPTSTSPRSDAGATPRPKASDKHPAQPRPGQAARDEPPASSGPPAMAPASAEPERPPALDAPRGGKADDLKQITGIGPKLEEKLNSLGIYHYDQIAGWGDSSIAWVDAELQARGRVERDNWVGQAAALKSGAKPSGGGGGAA